MVTEPIASTTRPSRRRWPGRRAGLVALAVAAALVVGACSGSSGGGTATGTAAPSSSATAGSATSGSASTGTAKAGSATGAGPAKYAGFTSAMYDDPANWLCAPGIPKDFCLQEDLRTTVVAPDGSTTTKEAPPAKDPTFDCFYVYPTVNLTGGPGTDDAMAADSAAEQAVLRNQFSRFRTACTTYAPLYRQITLSSFAAPNREELQAKAYGDVRDAFKTYMAKWNKGRPVLLIGHSQGSGLLAELLKQEFDDDPAMRAQLVSAILAGGFTSIPIGADVGGTLANIPACRSTTQTGCVIGFNSVTAGDDEAAQRWGGVTMPGQAPGPEQAGLTRLCTNPANLPGGPGPLLPVVPNQGTFAPGVTVSTPFVELPDAFTAQCTTKDQLTTLQVSAAPTASAGDVRDVARLIAPVPGWGLHINEVNLTMGNLLEIAKAQGAAKG
ncbi:MAG: DUF3089 domain-containing protein [Acidimicrobiales bacterium]